MRAPRQSILFVWFAEMAPKKGTVKLYLIIFNAVQLCGWSIVLLALLYHVLSGETNVTLWHRVSFGIQAFHITMLLEVSFWEREVRFTESLRSFIPSSA